MHRPIIVIAVSALSVLVAGCTALSPEPSRAPSVSAEVSVSAAPAPSASVSAPVEQAIDVQVLTDEDILGTMESGCAIQLFRAGDRTALVYYEGVEKAIMKIGGAVLPFTHTEGATLGDPVTRTLDGLENGYLLSVDTPLGESSPESDSTAISAGTLTITPNGGTPLTVDVEGGLAC